MRMVRFVWARFTGRFRRMKGLAMIARKMTAARQSLRSSAARAVAVFMLLLSVFSAQATTVTYNSSGTWTAPAGVTSATVEAWGGGGAGGGATGNPAKGGGGAGGQYAVKVVTVTPGNNYAVVVGAGGSGSTGNGTAGGDSTFNGTNVVAKGGAGGAGAAANRSGGAAGTGSTAGGIGTTVFAGGDGSDGSAGGSCNNGGAGGGGAGSGGTGGSASGNTAGTGTATGGGDGGAGRNNSGTGNSGSVAGGGGGGACAENNTNRSGGDGGDGMVVITYTISLAPTVTTNAATSLAATGATLNGTVSSNGASTTVTFDYGTTVAYGSSATAVQSPLAAGASGAAVSATISGLTCNTLYHFRVKGVNSAGTSNGSDLTFTTSACVPTATTNAATSLNTNGATLNGTVSSNGASTTVTFDYGTTVAYGSSATAAQSPVAGVSGSANATAVSAVVTGLTCGTLYHFRVKGVNSVGTTNGGDLTFTTTACAAPTVTTNAATSLTTTGATLNGTVSSNGASTTVTFDYGTSVAYGSSATAAQSPLAAGASGSAVSAAITGLTCGTLYHFRVKGVNTAGTSNGSDLTFTTSACPLPVVTSISRVSPNPTSPATAVSWTVLFNQSVTGVDTGDFVLVQAGGVSGASITSVTGSGTTWTVNANTGSGGGTLGLNLVDDDSIINASSVPLGGSGAGNGNFTGQVYTVSAFCSAPSNIPAGVSVSCVCDQFGRASLNPSTIFGGNWVVSTSDTTGVVPYINASTGHLRLTENTGNNAKAATVPSIFPAAGNYISVEFQHFAFNGSGADGIAVTLSDYSVPAVPGAFGGSLGYAQKNQASCGVVGGCPGFAGGWIGVALDEYGNYQNPTEGRILGPGAIAQSVGVRGPGNGANGYRWMGGTGGSPGGLSIDNRGSTTPAPGYMYQVIVDARNSSSGTVDVSVNRDSTAKDGTSYTSLFGPFNAYTEANYALGQGWIPQIVPDFWQISFTGSTGGATNVHEIGNMRICAQSVLPPSGGTASGFNAIDEAYGTPSSSNFLPVQNYLSGHIYTKLVGTPFKLNVAALSNNQIVTGYVVSGSKTVTVKLVDNSDAACVLDSSQANYCSSACTTKTAVTGGTQTMSFTSSDKGQKQSSNFTINTAYSKLVAVISDSSTTACSTDSFSVRPLSIASVTSSNATNSTTGGTPTFKAGSGNFSLTATTTGVSGNPSGYNGVIKINNTVVQPASPATVKGIVSGTFPAATPGTPSSTATGTAFTYNEVGGFTLPGYDPATDTTTKRSVYDGVATVDECTTPGLTTAQCDALRTATWTGVDSISSKGDCVANSYSNTKDANGKYGCIFGLLPNSIVFGRFVPDHFDTVVTPGMSCPTGLTCPTLTSANDQGFIYSGEPFTVTVYARNAAGNPTVNYDNSLGLSKSVTLSAWDAKGSTTVQDPPSGADMLNSNVLPATSFTAGVATTNTPSYSFASATTPPSDVYVRAEDTDNVTSLRGASSVEGGVKVVSGRIKVSNAYGSELLPLPLLATVQYCITVSSGICNWVTSTTDDATSFNTATNIGKSIVQGPLGVTDISVANAGPVMVIGGVRGFSLNKPGKAGSADITINAPPYLPPIAGRATFGVYQQGNSNFIYQRESY